MPEVTIRSFAKLREKLGEINKISVADGVSVYEAIERFAENNSAAKEELFSPEGLKTYIILMFNRERIDIDDAKEMKISDGDEIVLYPPVSGG
ncbi:MAG: MoaD/ThiS family protein [Methanocorpusculum sp.]|nr:MoaD/ThiS family protein [Methanocorpusculum sp.]